MNCDEFFKLLVERDDEPDAATRAALEEHARGCEDCQALAQGYEGFKEAEAHPERFPADPPHVQEAILAHARAKAKEREKAAPAEVEPPAEVSRKVVEMARRAVREDAPPPAAAPEGRLISFPLRRLLVAASLLVALGSTFWLGTIYKAMRTPGVDREYQEVARHELDLAESEKDTARARHALEVLQQLHGTPLNPGSTNPPPPGGLDTRVDQARAYHLLGNDAVARRLAESVIENGSEEDRAAAKALLEKIGK